MDMFSVCVTIICGMLGIAYPILIQITSNDKYSSETILNLFENDFRRKIFLPNLVFSLCFMGIYLLKLKPIYTFKNNFGNLLLENSALVILFISTITLIISFFLVIDLVKKFYRTSALIKYLTSQNKAVIEENNFSSFEGLSDLLYWSIQNQDYNASKLLSEYFYNIFKDYREKYSTDEGIIYPDKFYWLVYNAVGKIVGVEKNNLKFLENRTIGGIWLLGEFNAPKISENTYGWLWANIALTLDNNRDDLVFIYWQNAHQFFSFNLNYITPDYNFEDGNLKYINQEIIDKRNIEREKFLEFQYALGGLLLYKNKINIIKKIFNYTTSIPPDYILLPKHMTEIFIMFFKFLDPFESHFPWITHKYNFPGLEGLNADRTIKNWICKYIGILFIRQMNLNSHYVNWNPTDTPNLPNNLPDKRNWSENIKYFKSNIQKLTDENEELIKDLNFKNTMEIYIDKIESIEKIIIADFIDSQEAVEPEKDKIQLFLDSSKEILNKTFKKNKLIQNCAKCPPKKELNIYNIQGLDNITNKSDFTDDGVHHMNFDTFLAEIISSNYGDRVFQIFNTAASKKFVFDQENVFGAIDKLNLDPKNNIIVAFGFNNLNYYTENLKIFGLENDNYNKVQIILLPGRIYGISNSLFILAKDELPWFEYKDLDAKTQKLYDLNPILKDYNVYAGVSDLNINTALRQEIENEDSGEGKDLNKSVWQGIIFTTLLKWKKSVNIIQLQVKHNFENQKKLNKVDEIEPLNKK